MSVNGSLNWLANQSHPDVAIQVLVSQQSFPRPTVADAIIVIPSMQRNSEQLVTMFEQGR